MKIKPDFPKFCQGRRHPPGKRINCQDRNRAFDAFELHYIELPKALGEVGISPKTPFERWIHLLKFAEHYSKYEKFPYWITTPENIRHPWLFGGIHLIVRINEEGLAMAIREYVNVNTDKEYRQLLETREVCQRPCGQGNR